MSEIYASLSLNPTIKLLVVVAITTLSACNEFNWRLVSVREHSHSPPLLDLSFTDSHNGWGLTPTTLLETNDGGKTWSSRIEHKGAEVTFFSIEFLDSLNGFIVGSERNGNDRFPSIWRTSDAGKTWQKRIIKSGSTAPDAPTLLHSITFCDQEVGWAVGSNLILKTTDGGQTWATQRNDGAEGLLSVTCLSPERAWAVGSDGLILFTVDGGGSWNRQVSGTKENLARVRAIQGQLWVVGGRLGKSILLHSRNDGANWRAQNLNISDALYDIYLSDNRGWAVGSNGTIVSTTDGGQTWKREESPTQKDLMCLFFLSPNYVWAGGDHQTLLRLSE